MNSIFLILLHYIKPQYAIDKYFPSHVEFLNDNAKKGIFICSGRKPLKTGEFILCRAKKLSDVKDIVAQDPFDQYQLAMFEIVEYDLTAADDHFGLRAEK